MKHLIRKIGHRVLLFFAPELSILKKDWYTEMKSKQEDDYLNRLKFQFGFCGKNVIIHNPILIVNPQNVFLHDNTNIYGNATILTVNAKFTMKKNSGSAQGLTIVTGNHTSDVGVWFKELRNIKDEEKDVVIEEDVWVGANVTILAGVKIGRGSIIGASSVCRKNIPPYAIIVGNPAKVVGYRFTVEQVIEHEKILYSIDERISIDILKKNYDKYVINSLDEIKDYLKLSCP